MARLSDQEVWDWLEASCHRRGVPVVVTDVAVVQDVVALLGGPRGRGRAPARSASTTRALGTSQPPEGLNPVRVHGSGSGVPGRDDGVVHDGLDDGGLSGQVQGFPRSA